jgi:NADH:ubiquinone oxidoreductase subunit
VHALSDPHRVAPPPLPPTRPSKVVGDPTPPSAPHAPLVVKIYEFQRFFDDSAPYKTVLSPHPVAPLSATPVRSATPPVLSRGIVFRADGTVTTAPESAIDHYLVPPSKEDLAAKAEKKPQTSHLISRGVVYRADGTVATAPESAIDHFVFSDSKAGPAEAKPQTSHLISRGVVYRADGTVATAPESAIDHYLAPPSKEDLAAKAEKKPQTSHLISRGVVYRADGTVATAPESAIDHFVRRDASAPPFTASTAAAAGMPSMRTSRPATRVSRKNNASEGASRALDWGV